MPATGKSASQDGDKLKTHDVDPAFPQSVEYLSLGGPPGGSGAASGDLLIRVGFQRTGRSASDQTPPV